jgi:hypothetical protein
MRGDERHVYDVHCTYRAKTLTVCGPLPITEDKAEPVVEQQHPARERREAGLGNVVVSLA